MGANSLATNVSLSGGGTSTGGVSIGVSGGGGVSGVGGIGNTLFGNSTPTAANIDCVKYPQEFWSQIILGTEQRLLRTVHNPVEDLDDKDRDINQDKYHHLCKQEYSQHERQYRATSMMAADDGDITYLSAESPNLDLPLHNSDNEIGCNLYCC